MKLRLLFLLAIVAFAIGAAVFLAGEGFVVAADLRSPADSKLPGAAIDEPDSDSLPHWPGAPSALDRDPDEVRDPERARFTLDADSNFRARSSSAGDEGLENELTPAASLFRRTEPVTVLGRIVEVECTDSLEERLSPSAPGLQVDLRAHYASRSLDRTPPPGERTTVETDRSGHFKFRFAEPPRGLFIDRIQVRIEGDVRFRAFKRSFPTTSNSTDLGSLRRAEHSELRGHVVRPSGAPLSDARVVLTLGGPERVERVAHTDERGRWRLSDPRRLRDLAVFHSGYRMVHVGELSHSRSTECRPEAIGVRTMMAPTGRLEVVTNSELELQLVPEFLSVEPAPSVFMRTERTARRAAPFVTQPNEQGVLVFEDCWAGVPLRLRADPPESSRGGACFAASRQLEAKLILEGGTTRGRPIVVPPGKSLRVTLDLGEPLVVRGQIFRANGDPARLARVEATLSLNRLGAPNWRAFTESQIDPWIRTSTNQAGEYEFALPRLGYEGSLKIVAGYRSNKQLGSGWDQHAAETIETTAGQSSMRVDLNLIDDSFIAGRILDPFEESGTYFLRALPAGWARTDETTETGEIAQTRSASDGSFRLEGLPSGTYDLLVVREPALRHAFDLFEGIESGQDQVLELMTSKKKRARVTLLAAGRSAPVSRMLVMHGRTWLKEGETLEEGEHRVHSPTNWPLSWRLGAEGGNVETRVIGGLFQSLTTWTPERGLLLDPFDAGWHSFGLQAFDEHGEPYAPVWTGPVRLGQGMHTFHFDLIETVDVVGSVAGDSLPWPMYVALVKNGRRIALRASKDEPAHYVPVGADGRFHLWNAPVGDYEIWVGSAFDLDIGRPKRKQPITIERGTSGRSPTELTVLW